ncbi:MAG TPA: DUF72 domain-containing protein, partial [Solirubrobacteraceae bacterium]|nr:DUF72 domain-containing protein [Solirubrobacteraceae bacterium]
FDVKLHRLLSRHAAGPDALPPALREDAALGPRGRVRVDARLEAALADAHLEALEPLASAGKLGAFLLQLSPAFGPHEHCLDELSPLLERLAPHPVAIELRHRAWTRKGRLEPALGWMEEHGAVWVGVDAPAGEQITIMPPVDAVTNPAPAYLRAHGRDADAFVRGRSVAERFAYRYGDAELAEIAARARELAREAERVHVTPNNSRDSDAPVAAERMRELLAAGVSAA